MGQYGIKETCEVLNLVAEIGVAIIKEVKKDGFQPQDLGAFLKSPEVDALIAPALDKIEQVPLEMGELGFLDGVQLAKFVYANVALRLVEALKVG